MESSASKASAMPTNPHLNSKSRHFWHPHIMPHKKNRLNRLILEVPIFATLKEESKYLNIPSLSFDLKNVYIKFKEAKTSEEACRAFSSLSILGSRMGKCTPH